VSGQNPKNHEKERIRSGQSAARGATGDGQTGVPAGDQGISNRPGDAGGPDDDDALEVQGPDPDADQGEEEPGAEQDVPDDDGTDDDDDNDDAAEGPLMDPAAEPGKPI
jgi:hypothetical protein